MLNKKKKINYLESFHQMAIVRYAGYLKLKQYENKFLGDFLIKINNEGKKSLYQGARDKRLGIKAGVSDLFLAIPNKNYHGMWIEVKREGGLITKKQHEWFGKMQIMNYYTTIVYNLDDFIKEVNFYLGDAVKNKKLSKARNRDEDSYIDKFEPKKAKKRRYESKKMNEKRRINMLEDNTYLLAKHNFKVH
jgi:hypothetical protein